MNLNPITSEAPVNTEQLKRTGAAKDFEALLLSQMLHSVRSEGGGWLDSGDDQASDAAIGLGEEELAKALAQSGGIGLSKVIDAGLKTESKVEGYADGARGYADSARRTGSFSITAP